MGGICVGGCSVSCFAPLSCGLLRWSSIARNTVAFDGCIVRDGWFF